MVEEKKGRVKITVEAEINEALMKMLKESMAIRGSISKLFTSSAAMIAISASSFAFGSIFTVVSAKKKTSFLNTIM